MDHSANQTTDRAHEHAVDHLLHLVAVVQEARSVPESVERVSTASGELTAIVERVPAERFLSLGAEAGLQDAEVLAQRAAHHDSLTRGIETRAILPIPFGTIFETDESLKAFLETNTINVSKFLTQTTDHSEFAIKGFADLRAIARTNEADDFKSNDARDVGFAYLNRAKQKAQSVVQARQQAVKLLDSLAEPLDLLSTDSSDREVRESMHTDAQTCMFNWAFLVPNEHANLFISKINDINASTVRKHVSLQWSGPYPPYSFLPDLKSAS